MGLAAERRQQRRKPLERRRKPYASVRGGGIDDQAAANRHRRRIGPQHESIASSDRRLGFEADPCVAALAAANREDAASRSRHGHHRNARQHLAGALVKSNAGIVPQRPRRGQHLDPRIDRPSRLARAWRDQHLTARQVLHLDARDVQCGALACFGAIDGCAVHLDATHLHAPRSRDDLQLVIDAKTTRDQGTRHHRPEPAHREDAVDRQPRGPVRRPIRRRAGQCAQGVPETIEPRP